MENEDSAVNFLPKHYPPDYLRHIIIDECHRCAWGKWFQVLGRNPNAMQIGLTGTPRTLEITEKSMEAEGDHQITADNASGLTPLRVLGKPAAILRETKERMFAA